MARDYEDGINLDQMDDGDIGGLVRQELHEADDFDVDDVDVTVRDGHIRVEGRVGTEGERQRVEQVLGRLGAIEFTNNVMVDENVRAQRSDAADTARIEDAAVGSPLGESSGSDSDTAEHLREDTAGDMYGTHDVKKAVEGGQSYTPPDGPVQEGTGGGENT